MCPLSSVIADARVCTVWCDLVCGWQCVCAMCVCLNVIHKWVLSARMRHDEEWVNGTVMVLCAQMSRMCFCACSAWSIVAKAHRQHSIVRPFHCVKRMCLYFHIYTQKVWEIPFVSLGERCQIHKNILFFELFNCSWIYSLIQLKKIPRNQRSNRADRIKICFCQKKYREKTWRKKKEKINRKQCFSVPPNGKPLSHESIAIFVNTLAIKTFAKYRDTKKIIGRKGPWCRDNCLKPHPFRVGIVNHHEWV